MGYESRLYIVDKRVIPARKDGCADDVYAAKIAQFNMSCMESSFRNIFNNPLDFDFIGENDEDLTVDNYGDKVKYSDVQPVIEWLKESTKREHYRRTAPLIAFLEALKPEEWEHLIVIHYGY